MYTTYHILILCCVIHAYASAGSKSSQVAIVQTSDEALALGGDNTGIVNTYNVY